MHVLAGRKHIWVPDGVPTGARLDELPVQGVDQASDLKGGGGFTKLRGEPYIV